MELIISKNGTEPQKSAEVVIIGGGVVGSAIACFLARDGVDVCLLERGDVASGTAGAAAVAALMQTKTSVIKLALAKRSLDLLDDLHERFNRCFEYTHSGSLLVANSPAEMEVVENMAAKLHRLGLDVQLVSGDEARSIMPLLGSMTVGGSYSSRDAIINPLKLVVAYTAVARHNRANIYTFTKVTGIETSGNRIHAVLTNKGKIQCRKPACRAAEWIRSSTLSVG